MLERTLTWMSSSLNSFARVCERPRTANFPLDEIAQLGAPRFAPVALVNARKPRFPCSLGLHKLYQTRILRIDQNRSYCNSKKVLIAA